MVLLLHSDEVKSRKTEAQTLKQPNTVYSVKIPRGSCLLSGFTHLKRVNAESTNPECLNKSLLMFYETQRK